MYTKVIGLTLVIVSSIFDEIYYIYVASIFIGFDIIVKGSIHGIATKYLNVDQQEMSFGVLYAYGD